MEVCNQEVRHLSFVVSEGNERPANVRQKCDAENNTLRNLNVNVEDLVKRLSVNVDNEAIEALKRNAIKLWDDNPIWTPQDKASWDEEVDLFWEIMTESD